uniref:Uncharacterized protein n=1 Tax=Anguilla anguilla TaxID=7936 RepID=A0A0E9UAD7_ANGAN
MLVTFLQIVWNISKKDILF